MSSLQAMFRVTLVSMVIVVWGNGGLAGLRTACAQEGRGGPPQGGRGPMVDRVMNRLDTDKDGMLSQSEYRGPVPFETVDADGDGFVTREELEQARPQGPGMGGGGTRMESR